MLSLAEFIFKFEPAHFMLMQVGRALFDNAFSWNGPVKRQVTPHQAWNGCLNPLVQSGQQRCL